MKLALVHRSAAACPYRLLDDADHEIAWANDFLDAQHLRQLSPRLLRGYALGYGRPFLWVSMALRSCSVSFDDGTGVRHTVQVTAETLFEAAALALRSSRRTGQHRVPPRTEIAAQATVVNHSVTVRRVPDWLTSGGNGGQDGSDLDDWLQAEQKILGSELEHTAE
jgi:hypothetical protein